jgi:hypothetical protein
MAISASLSPEITSCRVAETSTEEAVRGWTDDRGLAGRVPLPLIRFLTRHRCTPPADARGKTRKPSYQLRGQEQQNSSLKQAGDEGKLSTASEWHVGNPLRSLIPLRIGTTQCPVSGQSPDPSQRPLHSQQKNGRVHQRSTVPQCSELLVHDHGLALVRKQTRQRVHFG